MSPGAMAMGCRKHLADPALRTVGAEIVTGVQHGDDGFGADAIEASPLAMHQALLHTAPVGDIGSPLLRRRAVL